ncbi:MAG: PfkB family carbohydrate kinase, partial [Planctomycetota bacterium]
MNSNHQNETGVPLIIGEVLWDCFPNRSVLGGAPLNVAWNLRGFGLEPILLSAVGDDDLGHQALERMQAWGLSTDAIAVLPHVATGTVEIKLIDGEPEYDIVRDVAFDKIPTPSSNQLSAWRERIAATSRPAAIYHGSLALR